MIVDTCAFSRTRVGMGDEVLYISSTVGDTVSLVRECEQYVRSLEYHYSSKCPIKDIACGPYRYGSVVNYKCATSPYQYGENRDDHTFLVHRGIVEGLLGVNLSNYSTLNIETRSKFTLEVGIPIVRAAMAARIQLWGVGNNLGLIDEEEEARVRGEIYRLSSQYIKPQPVPPPTMWVIRGKVYRNEQEAIDRSRELTCGLTEEDIEFWLDELSSDDKCSVWMGTAVEYLRDRGFSDGRICGYEHRWVCDVGGLKNALGKEGWVEFLTLLGMDYKIKVVTEA